jgi:hypothetical protein
MAGGVSRTIDIIFAGVDQVSSITGTISNNLDTLSTSIGDIGAPFADATEKVLLLDAAIAGIAIAGISTSSSIEAECVRMQNALGLTNEEAEKFEDIAKDVYKAGWGDDLAASFDAVVLAQQKLGDNAEVDIGRVTEQAFELQKAFSTDVSDSLGAVDTLMNNFGLTSDEAFSFITKGFHDGLNGSGDLLESINEYSTQFVNGGADAGQFFSVLSSGFSEGILGTDKAADMFKEFRVSIQNESTLTNDALESIGIDPEAFAQNMASGELTAIEAFGVIQEALNNTDDKTVQLNAGVALMGTQFEDMGTKAALAVNTTNTSLDDMKGKIDSIDVATFEQKFTSALRTITTEFGDMSQWDDAKEAIGQVFEDIASSFGPAMENVDFSELEGAVEEVWNTISQAFADADIDLTTVEGMENAIQLVVDSLESLANITEGMVSFFDPIITSIIDAIKWFNDLDESTKETTGFITALGASLTVVSGLLGVGSALFVGISSLAGLLSSGGALSTGISSITTLLTGPVGLGVALGAIAIAATELSFSGLREDIAKSEEAISKANEDIKTMEGLLEQINALPPDYYTLELQSAWERGDFDTAQQLITELTEEAHIAEVKAEAKDDQIIQLINSLGDIPAETQAAIMVAAQTGDLEEVDRLIKEIPEELRTKVDVTANTEKALASIKYIDEYGNEQTIKVPVEADGVDDAKKKVEDIPSEKLVEIQLQGDIDTQIAQIEASAETVQAAMEWEAKVEIAQVEAAAETMQTAFETTGETVQGLSTSVSDMFSSLVENFGGLSLSEKWEFMEVLESQQEMEQQALNSQIAMNEAMTAYYTQQKDALDKGDALITIDTSGAEPAVAAVIESIITEAQIRMNSTASSMLFGAV